VWRVLRINYWSKKRDRERYGRYPFSKKFFSDFKNECGEKSQQWHSCAQIMNCYYTARLPENFWRSLNIYQFVGILFRTRCVLNVCFCRMLGGVIFSQRCGWKFEVYCDVKPCRLVNVYRRVGSSCWFHIQVSYPETLERTYKSTWRCVPGDWIPFYMFLKENWSNAWPDIG
jgi:hypothetical protein